MTSSAAFRCVQAWLLEKPAAWADEDAPCLAAALMAQRPPCDTQRKRPREDALLEAERSHQRHLIAQLDWELLGETLCRVERERENRNLRRRVDGLNNIIDRERERATLQLPAENYLLALPLLTARCFSAELPTKARDETPVVQTLGLEQCILRGRM